MWFGRQASCFCLFTYALFHYDAGLLHGPEELIEVDFARILNVEVLEHLLQELHLVHVGCVLLRYLCSELSLEPVQGGSGVSQGARAVKIATYSFINCLMLFCDIFLFFRS